MSKIKNNLSSADILEKFDLIKVQKESWDKFVKEGLRETIKEFFPIDDYTKKKFVLYFDDLFFGTPRFPIELCLKKKLTYDQPVYIKVKLINKKTGKESTQEVYFFNLPIMTERATFIINGIERAVINQISRSPGIFFTAEIDKSTGEASYNAEIRPYIGSWIDITIGKNNLIEMKINKKRKFLATTFVKIFDGENSRQLLSYFQDLDRQLIEKYLLPTLNRDNISSKDDAYLEIYKRLKPGEPPIVENAHKTLQALFFDPRRYSLNWVGRYKVNKKLGLNTEISKENFLLNKIDIIEGIKYLLNLTVNKGEFDDIDHLGNRRLRTVGELVDMYGIRVGMMRVEREIKERMSLVSNETKVLPSIIINAKPLTLAINRFFRTSQLSTIVDQVNPLSELDNLRRITVGGPGGIEKERASFSIRDISSSQYGRICPVRSPEGTNIGVVTYLATYARVNNYGFIETPYRKLVKEKLNGKVRVKISDEIVYLQADDEENFYISYSDLSHIDDSGYLLENQLVARHKGEIVEVPVEKIDFIDLSPRQVVGVSASLIPFLQNDDASRALMGSHMQCQAVPLLKPERPLVGTGMEKQVATTLGRTIVSPEDGIIEYVDGKGLTLVGKSGRVYHYGLDRYQRTNKDVVFDQRPRVSLNQKVRKGDVLVDGPATDSGDLALGKNLIVAYTSFQGYGYEDSIVISDRLIKDDVFTSISAEEFVADLVNTKLGPEELTRDIPNVREETLQNLDKDGLVVVGSEVKPGDILVGKVAPKGERELTAEERLLRAIFGEKAKDVKDTSLRMPYGKRGVVTNIEIIDVNKDPNELDPGIIKRVIVTTAQLRKIIVGDKLAGRHGNKGIISKILPSYEMPFLEDGTPVDLVISPISVLSRMNLGQILEGLVGVIAKYKNKAIDVPVFERMREEYISEQLKKINWPVDGKKTLYHGQSGEPFERPVFVGIGYILKLVHMVEDKFHARSIGPYSLVTQQPLSGKSQMGGQRFGEMEVWALESHRVPYILQEMLTIKSDDVRGRMKAFESIIKGLDIPQSGVPESFKVLLKELNSLALSIDFIK
jgi:DNA-directed RNA polymerase subunit beta